MKNILTLKVKCEYQTTESRRGFLRYVSNIVHEWNSHLEIFSRPQGIENSRQYLLLLTDILQVVGCP